MNIIIKQNTDAPLTVTIEYPEYNNCVEKLVNDIKMLDQYISGSHNGRIYKIKLVDICYIESVDKSVFAYTCNDVFRLDKKLYQAENMLSKKGFIKISKSCILNINFLKNIKSMMNSKLEAVLTNDEKLIVSRTYLKNIRDAISKEELI